MLIKTRKLSQFGTRQFGTRLMLRKLSLQKEKENIFFEIGTYAHLSESNLSSKHIYWGIIENVLNLPLIDVIRIILKLSTTELILKMTE